MALHHSGVLGLAAVLLLTGCATGMPVGWRTEAGNIRHRRFVPRDSPATRAPADDGGGGAVGPVAHLSTGAWVMADGFEALLLRAGLEPTHALPPREAPFTPEDAALLYDALLERPVTLEGFGPRRVAFHLLGELMEGEAEVPREALLQRLERYRHLAVLRPDGCLAGAVSGQTRQRVGPVQWREGAFRAGRFEVGPFYSALVVYRPVDARLQPVRGSEPLADVHDDADVISRALDGAQESFVELTLAVGQLLSHPLDSAAALTQLPEGLAALLASSPEYLERFRLMPRGE